MKDRMKVQAYPLSPALQGVAALRGYTPLASGSHKTALLSPDKRTVVLCYVVTSASEKAEVDLHRKWVDYCKHHATNIHLPMFGGTEVSEVGSVAIIMTKTEYLLPISDHYASYFALWGATGLNDLSTWTLKAWRNAAWSLNPKLYDLIQHQQPKFFDTFFDLLKAGRKIDAPHINIMRRREGTLVINDPWSP